MAEANEDILCHMENIEDFYNRYIKLCLDNKICPAKSIKKNIKDTDLSCIVEAIRPDHWKCILLALCRDNSLAKVHFASCILPHEDEDEDELVAPENIGLKLVPVPAGQMDCQTELCIGCCSPAVYRGFIPLVDIQTKVKKHAQYLPTPYGRTPKNVNNIATAVHGLLEISQTLTILKLENLPFKLEDARQLADGLYKSSPSLTYFSLSGCHFEEDAIPTICNGLKVSSVSWIDLSFCALNQTDIEAIASVIKAHCIRRRNDMFQKTLRSQVPHLQDMPGLRRVSLNYNSLEDKTLKILIESLDDDLWIKALDLQNCDIDNAGAVALLNLATTNTSLLVIDLRMNQIDGSLLDRISKQLEQNKAGTDVKCSEIPLWKPSDLVRKYNNIGKMKTLKKPTAHKFKISKKVTKSYLNVKKKSRFEDFFEHFTHEKHPEIKYTCVMSPRDKILFEKDISCPLRDASCQTERPSRGINDLLVLAKDLKRRLENEMKIRKFLLAKYRQVTVINGQLRQWLKSQNDDIYVDQETYFDVKHTFEKLKVFFDVMKKYGLWEYISMLGFDESTDVILEENNSQKFMKITRDETSATVENQEEFDREVCCNCRKLEFKPRKVEPPDEHHCMAGASTKPLHNKIPTKKDEINEKTGYKVLQEAVHDYNGPHQVLHCKFVSGRMSDLHPLNQDNIKLPGCKQSGSVPPNTATGAQMFIKKFSYSNMPKQLKELVSPADFYNIVKKELERCELEAKKPYSLPTENHESSNSTQVNSTQSKKPLYKTHKCRNEVTVTTTAERRGSSTRQDSKISEDEEENVPISQLIAKEKAAVNCRKYILPKKESKSPTLSTSKVSKNTNHAKIKETKTLNKSEEKLLLSKHKLWSAFTNCKKVQSQYNASSDEINSSDSVVTPNDKVSPHSSISSSSSSKSHVTDASTFGEIESIVDSEVVSETFLPTENVNVKSSANASSHSSTLKESSESKSNKSNKSAMSGSPSIKDSSKKDEKSTKAHSQPQGKSKNANKHSKNRPKSNSSKSSSIPSLSDITTVSSKNLKTYSVMKQIPGSDDDKSKGKK